MKLFNKVKAYVYFVAYRCDGLYGNIEIISLTKLDSFKELNITKETIATHLGKIGKGDDIIITNFILLKREYRDKWW